MDTHDNNDELELCWIHKIKLIKKVKEYSIPPGIKKDNPFYDIEKDVYFECPMCKDVLKV
jgi:hypothetical protein